MPVPLILAFPTNHEEGAVVLLFHQFIRSTHIVGFGIPVPTWLPLGLTGRLVSVQYAAQPLSGFNSAQVLLSLTSE